MSTETLIAALRRLDPKGTVRKSGEGFEFVSSKLFGRRIPGTTRAEGGSLDYVQAADLAREHGLAPGGYDHGAMSFRPPSVVSVEAPSGLPDAVTVPVVGAGLGALAGAIAGGASAAVLTGTTAGAGIGYWLTREGYIRSNPTGVKSITPWLVGAGVIGLIAYALRPAAQQAPTQTRPIQTRPLNVSTPEARAAVLRIVQQQLRDLGYRVTTINGISGPETQAAITAFFHDHAAQVPGWQAQYAGESSRGSEVLMVDDVYRARFGT